MFIVKRGINPLQVRTNNLTTSLIKLAFVLTPLASPGQTDTLQSDSCGSKRKLYNFKSTARIHSLGIFAYAGVIANDNPCFDWNVTYDRKKWGFIFIKAIDLYDLHSPYDFSLVLLYSKIKVSENFTIVPYAGFDIDQRHSFIDRDSDGMIILISSWKLNKTLTIEHTGRFSNTFIATENFDWLNRFRLLATEGHFDLWLGYWHNNAVFRPNTYASTGLSIGYSRIHVSESVMMSTLLTGMFIMHDSGEEDRLQKQGLIFTIAATLD